MKPINMSKSRQQEFIILSACFWKVEHFLMNDVQFSLLWILHMYVNILMNDMFFISLHFVTDIVHVRTVYILIQYK